MPECEWLADRFEEERPRLRSVAYRTAATNAEGPRRPLLDLQPVP
jgi:hypothetical protein